MAEVEEVVGDLMTSEPAVLPDAATVAEALSFLVKSAETSQIEHIFVTGEERLAGVVTMRDLVMAKPSDTLGAIMASDPVAFQVDTSIGEAMRDALTHHSPVYAVVDDDHPVRRLLRKEILLGALNGSVVGLLAGIAMFAYAIATGAVEPMLLGLVIFVAMIGACVGSGIFGVVVPLTLRHFGADPATASSIFLTTFTDVLGMGLMLFLATVIIL